MLRCLTCITLLMSGTVPALASLLMVGPVDFGSTTPLTVLSIQNAGTASGCVGFIAGGDVTGLAACPGGFTGAGGNELMADTATATVGQLQSAGVNDASKLLLVFHSGEPTGTALDLSDLAVVFFDVSTDTTFTANLPGTPVALTTAGSGNPSTGIAFKLDPFEAFLANGFMANMSNRVGVDATISGTTGAADSFFLAAQTPVSAVPEPGVSWLAGFGLIAISIRRLKTFLLANRL